MKIYRCHYNDDGTFIPGVLFVSLFNKTFYPHDSNCGWSSQKITSKNKHLIQY